MTDASNRLNELFLTQARDRFAKAKTIEQLSDIWREYAPGLNRLDDDTFDALCEIRRKALLLVTGGAGVA